MRSLREECLVFRPSTRLESLCLGLFLFVVTIPLLPGAVAAEECSPLLKPDVTVIMTRDDVRLAYLYTLNVNTFDETKKSGGAEATIPVDGIPLKEIATFSDFQSHFNSESRRLQYEFKEDKAQWYYATRIPPERSAEYLACVNGRNLKLEVEERTNDNRVALKITWNAPAGMSNEVALDFSASTNAVELPSKGTLLKDKASHVFVFQRKEPAVDMLIVVNSEFHPLTFKDPAPMPVHVAEPKDKIALRLRGLWNAKVTYQGPDSGGASLTMRLKFDPCETADDCFVTLENTEGGLARREHVLVLISKDGAVSWDHPHGPAREEPQVSCARSFRKNGGAYALTIRANGRLLTGNVMSHPDDPNRAFEVCGIFSGERPMQ